MSNATHDATAQQASAEADASLRQLITDWQAFFQSIKLKLQCHADLIGADFRLSVKALAICLLSILLLVGFVMTLWATLMITLAYSLVTFGLHWAISAAVVVLLNLGVLYVLKQILSDALKSISLQATANALLSSEQQQ